MYFTLYAMQKQRIFFCHAKNGNNAKYSISFAKWIKIYIFRIQNYLLKFSRKMVQFIMNFRDKYDNIWRYPTFSSNKLEILITTIFDSLNWKVYYQKISDACIVLY